MASQPNDLRAALQAALGEPYVIEREAGAADSLRSGLWMAARAFVARDSAGHRVVVNVVPDTIAAQVDAATFCREAQLATSLRHPHLIPLIGAGTAPHLLYYLTPLMDGESLRQRLDASGGKLPVLDAVRIAIDAAGALQAAHEQGMVHRDVTPENVFLAGAHAVIANVGLSRAVSRSLLQPPPGGRLVGTPAYMSPEQMAGAANLDGRSDIYSLGCVLYEMLTGARPFAGVGDGTPREHRALLPEPAQRRRREIPRSLDAVLMKTLASRPEDRYPTAAALRHALLDEVARRRGLPFRGVASILSMAKRAFSPLRRKGWPS